MNHLYFIHFTQATSDPVQFPMLSTSWKFNIELYSKNAENTKTWKSLVLKFQAEMGMWCFERKTPFCSWLFAVFFPPLCPMFWVQRHPGASKLRNIAAQDKDRGNVLTVPWSIPNEKSSISMGRLCRAAHEEMGHLRMSLRSPSWLRSIKRLRRIVAWCFNDIYYDS